MDGTNMRNLVLGSSGFVGRYLCDYLRAIGEQVVEYDIVRDDQEDCRFAKLPLDGIDRVYFLAWQVGGANYLYDPNTQREQLDWNIKLLTNSMDQLTNVPFVFVSSQLAEDCDTVYGVLKRLGEVWTQLNGGRVVRFWNVYGAYEDQSIKSHVVADFVHQALSNDIIQMQTNGNELRQFVYAEDVCRALHTSFECSGVFDASTLQWNSIYEVAELISKYTGCKIERGIREGTTLMIDNKSLVVEPKTLLEDGIRRTVDLFRKRRKTQ
jgi:nucleoside-diphosphate-sugar epimerase